MTLNNHLQARFGSTRSLTWEREQVGPQHACQWTVVAYCMYLLTDMSHIFSYVFVVEGIEYGRGIALYSAAAEETAAYYVLVNLGVYHA